MIHKFYRIANDANKTELVYKFADSKLSESLLAKIKQGLKQFKPWHHGIPYYKNCKFAFTSINAMNYFIYNILQLNEDDINELTANNYYIEELELNTYSRGMSNILATYFNDEVDTVERHGFADYDKEYDAIDLFVDISDEEISFCKDSYYSK